MGYVLALDQGTSSSRAIVFDVEGRVCGMAQQALRQIFPQPGWVEHDPEEIWLSQLETARAALAKAGVAARDLAALGISNQRETTLLWERASGRPLGNAIVWQDRRSADLCESMKHRRLEALFRERTGLLLNPYFSATKLVWMLSQIPGARARAERGELAFGTVDTWLIWRLTGGRVHATDASNASRTLLYDIYRHAWDEELLTLCDIPQRLLPDVKPSSAIFGETNAEWLGSSVLIGGVAGDQQAALFGQACTASGMVKNTYGTGCFMLMHTGSAARSSHQGLLTTVAASAGEAAYALEGSVFVAGAVVQWLRDELGLIGGAAEIEALAASVPSSAGVVLVPAFSGLGSPYWDPYARGAIFGLTRGAGRAELARAALEAIAFQSAELLGAMQADAETPIESLRVDGGASVNNLLLQIQADLLGVPVVRPQIAETTALGAAYLAGLASGLWSSQQELAANWQAERVFEPALGRDEAAARMARWRKAVALCREWAV